LTQNDLLRFDPLGNVTLLHLTDLHGQLMPLYFREPSINIGVGEAKGKVPHLTGADVRTAFALPAGSPLAYALSYDDFSELAKVYGRMGGLDRIATVIKSIRAERGDKVLLLDGGDTWTNSWTALKTSPQVRSIAAVAPMARSSGDGSRSGRVACPRIVVTSSRAPTSACSVAPVCTASSTVRSR